VVLSCSTSSLSKTFSRWPLLQAQACAACATVRRALFTRVRGSELEVNSRKSVCGMVHNSTLGIRHSSARKP
jgi:hypothetical protein